MPAFFLNPLLPGMEIIKEKVKQNRIKFELRRSDARLK